MNNQSQSQNPKGKGESAKKKNVWVQMARYSQLAFVLPAATVVGWALGALLDRWLGTTWMTLAGVVAGVVAGFVELLRGAAAALDKD